MVTEVKNCKKRIINISLVLLIAAALFACGRRPQITPTSAPETSGAPTGDPSAKAPSNGSLAINEIYAESADDNWIEIKNLSNETVSLNGVVLNVSKSETGSSSDGNNTGAGSSSDESESRKGREGSVKLDGHSLKPGELLVIRGGDKKLGKQATAGNTVTDDGGVYAVDQDYFVLSAKMKITINLNSTEIASFVVPADLNGCFSYGLNGSGEPVYFLTPTPGSANGGVTEKSAEKFSTGTGLKINEYMNGNSFILADEDGDGSDWAEIVNNGATSVNLANFGLTDNFKKPAKWVFPEIILEPGEMLIVFLSGKEKAYVPTASDGTNQAKVKTVHASFKLGDKDDGLMLSNNYGVKLDSVELGKLHNSLSYGRSTGDADKWLYFTNPTPGSENAANGFENIDEFFESAENRVFISEVCAVSSSAVKELDNDDWIELFNNSDKDVKLKGWSITKNKDKPDYYTFPDVTIKAHGYLVIKAGDKASTKAGSLDTGFKIGASGTTIYLFNSEKGLMDSFKTGIQRAGVTSGRTIENGKLETVFFTEPTKGKANAKGYKAYASPVVVASDTQTLNAKKHTVTLTTTQQNGKIYYTLDGSNPTAKSTLYTEPFTVEKSCVVKAVCVADGFINADITTKTFLCDDRTHTLNIVCVSSDPDGLYSYENGIFADGPGYTEEFPHEGANYWKDWERACTFEYYTPDGNMELNFDAGMKIHGAWSRGLETKSFQIKLKEAYGPKSIEYPLFGDQGISTFSNFIVRSGGQAQYKNYITDAYIERVVEGQMDLAVHDEMPVAVYVNGKYYGMYFIREKLNEDYYLAHDGIEADNLDAIKGNTIVETGNLTLQKQVIKYIQEHDMSTDESLKYIESVVDIDEWMNYWIVVTFFGNADTGNIRKYTAKDGSVKWRWLLYDQDLAMMPKEYDNNILSKILSEKGHGYESAFYNYLTRALLIDNQKTREKFIERYAEVMQTVLTKERLLAVFNDMRAQVDGEMKYHCAIKESIYYEGWTSSMDTFAKNLVKRWDNSKKFLKKEFNLSDARMAELFPEKQDETTPAPTKAPEATATPTPKPTATPVPTQAVPAPVAAVDPNMTYNGEKVQLLEKPIYIYALQKCSVSDFTSGKTILNLKVSNAVIARGLFKKSEQYLVETTDGKLGYAYKWNFAERALVPEIKYTSENNYGFKYMIFIGDSRFRGMRESTDGETVIAQNGEGYDFLVANIDQAKAEYTNGAVIVIGLGINDTWNYSKYINYVNELAKTYKVAYVNITPVDEPRSVKWDYNYYNKQLETFNTRLKAGLSKDVILLDANTYLHEIGFDTLDGIHYVGNTYRNIYNFIKGSLVKQK